VDTLPMSGGQGPWVLVCPLPPWWSWPHDWGSWAARRSPGISELIPSWHSGWTLMRLRGTAPSLGPIARDRC